MRGRGARREAGVHMGGGGASGMHGEGSTQGLGARARAERTENMIFMSVTLDVSQLSGWLKAFATCRVERRACVTGRGARREAGGSGAAAEQKRHAQGRPASRLAWGPGHARSARGTCSPCS